MNRNEYHSSYYYGFEKEMLNIFVMYIDGIKVLWYCNKKIKK
jgi:hypothetical protein